VRTIAGTLNLATAAIMGRVMFTPLNSGRYDGWPLVMLGAPILLMLGGVRILFPYMKQIFLLALCGGSLFLTGLRSYTIYHGPIVFSRLPLG
jgi:hypothetical protein